MNDLGEGGSKNCMTPFMNDATPLRFDIIYRRSFTFNFTKDLPVYELLHSADGKILQVHIYADIFRKNCKYILKWKRQI